MRWRLIGALSALVLALDQLTKHWVLTSLELHEAIPVTSFFNLVSVRNRGAAFGFLSDPESSWQVWLFAAAALVAIGIICFVAKGAREKDKVLFTGLGCIMGGAVGNLIDRIRLGEVVDFLDFHYAGMHWPAFNVADIAICLGAAITLLYMLRGESGKDSAGAGPGRKAGR